MSTMKKLLLIILGLLAAVLVGFVVKESILFDSENPYGAKEVSSDFAKALPAAEKPTFDPADFGSTSTVPLASEDAKRAAAEYLASESKRRGFRDVRFDFVRTSKAGDGTVFEFRSVTTGEVARIRMDRLGTFSIIAVPSE